MSSLANKQILVGIGGGIAAYKCAELVRRLQDAGASVRVAMTRAGTEFITPLTMQALSGHQVHLDLLDPEAEAGMGHIELARWADAVVIAPATADLIARLAAGEAGDLLTAICMATDAPIAVAPAMNQGMWHKASTQQNLDTLARRHFRILGPAQGHQACGDVGPGRMLEAAELVAGLEPLFDTGVLAGKQVLITAGPTREAIDPVRYISNYSSGKMGYALAEAAADAGARTLLISGPVNLPCPPRVERQQVLSAQQMLEACLAAGPDCDLFIGAAAVADYRPLRQADNKIKKSADQWTLEMEKTPDIISAVANLDPHPFTVGFAAETSDVLNYAQDKLARKHLDAIIANDVSRSDIGFDSDDNQVLFITTSDKEELPLLSKPQLARRLIDRIAALMQRGR